MKLGVFYGPSGDLHGVDGLVDDLKLAAEATELQAIFDAGADDVICSEFSTSPEDKARTRACLTSLL